MSNVFDDIIALGIEDREERMQAIQDAIDAGHVPDERMRERLANYIPLKVAEEVGTDGRNYRIPSRRKRGRYENMLVDKYARSRNQRRRRAYNAFVAGKDSYMHEGEDRPFAFIKKAEAIR